MKQWVALLITCLCGCAPDAPTPPPPMPKPAFVESVATPDMVADLHRRQADYFAHEASASASEASTTSETPQPAQPHVVRLEWERIEGPSSFASRSMHRTKIPEGWLVYLHGDVAIIVSDSNHVWGAGQ